MDTILTSAKEESRRTFHSGEKQGFDTHSDFSRHLRKMASSGQYHRGEGNPEDVLLDPREPATADPDASSPSSHRLLGRECRLPSRPKGSQRQDHEERE